jgi:hypothetical protein
MTAKLPELPYVPSWNNANVIYQREQEQVQLILQIKYGEKFVKMVRYTRNHFSGKFEGETPEQVTERIVQHQFTMFRRRFECMRELKPYFKTVEASYSGDYNV